MPYREKTAWLTLIAVALTFGPYFTLAALDLLPDSNLQKLLAYGIAAVVQMALLGVGHLGLRWQNPVDARLPADERDLAISYRSRTLAYYVLIAGFMWVGVIMPFGATGWRLTNAALFMIASAEAVGNAATIYFYRKQS